MGRRNGSSLIMKTFFIRLFKGVAMGAANVIPGVSGGTIALITNIYEELIDSLKSFNLNALKLLFKGQFKSLNSQLNLNFLIPIMLGIVLSILSLAKLFDYLLIKYPSHTWAYFFGLVLASVYYVGLKIKEWNWKIISILILGIVIALTISFVSPSPTEDTSYFYIFICGLIGICGMILPGLSGSYILMLMGNYHLLMVKSINSISEFVQALASGNLSSFLISPDFELLIYFIIFLIGSVVGLIAFSNIISWVFNKYHDATLALLTGFVFGSLSIIWPWKKEIISSNIIDRHGEPLLLGYERYFPSIWGINEAFVIVFMLIGVISIIVVEYLAKQE
jgi:putative membrane protein